jgi:hypothetical protein
MIVVVDNNPGLQDALVEAVNGKGVKVIGNEGSGAADARSTAARATDVDFLAFIDDDAWADAAWLENLATRVVATGAVGVGGLVLPEWQPGSHTLPAELLWLVGCTYKGHPVEETVITRAIGANMGVRRRELLEIGGFPSAFGPREGRKSSSNEELVMFTALRRRFGEECVLYVPSAVVHHTVPAERTDWRYLVRRSWAEGSSKADAVSVYGREAMGYDGRYVVHTLAPGIASYCREAASGSTAARLRDCAMCVGAFVVTGAAYAYKAIDNRQSEKMRQRRSSAAPSR